MKTLTKFLVLSIFNFLVCPSYVVAQQQVFTKVFEYISAGNDMIKTPDNHFIICGCRYYNAFVFKMDLNGDIKWAKEFGEFGEFGIFTSIALTHDSCFVLSGNIQGSGLSVIKMNLSGDVQWFKSIEFGGMYNYWEALQIIPTNDSGSIVVCKAFISSWSLYDIAVVKLDSTGNFIWAKSYPAQVKFRDMVTIKETPDSGFILLGTAHSTTPDSYNPVLIKLSSDGTLLWSKTPFLEGVEFYSASDLLVFEDGVVLSLQTWNSNYNVLLKTDFSSNIVWGRTLPLSIHTNEFGAQSKMNATSDGCIIIPGSEGMLKINSNGNLLWGQQLFLYALEAIECDDKGYLVMGMGPLIAVKLEGMSYQLGIIKTDSLGNSSDCTYPDNPPINDLDVVLQDFAISPSSIEVTISDSYNSISDISPSSRSGCVDAIGGYGDHQAGKYLLSIIPNPSRGLFKIVLNSGEAKDFRRLEIYNFLGEKVYESDNPIVLQTAIDLQGEPNGIYFIRCASGNTTASGRVIIHN